MVDVLSHYCRDDMEGKLTSLSTAFTLHNYDKGRCIHHPHVRLRKKERFGGGWKTIHTLCPECCMDEMKLFLSIEGKEKEYVQAIRNKKDVDSFELLKLEEATKGLGGVQVWNRDGKGSPSSLDSTTQSLPALGCVQGSEMVDQLSSTICGCYPNPPTAASEQDKTMKRTSDSGMSSQHSHADQHRAFSGQEDAEAAMRKELVEYIELLRGNPSGSQGGRSGESSSETRVNPLVVSINEALDAKFNSNPRAVKEIIEYYGSHPNLREFTLESDLPRMDYKVLVRDAETGEDKVLVDPHEIRSYFTFFGVKDEEVDILLRASNQSLLADPLTILASPVGDSLVHSGNFLSMVMASTCIFELDLRREGRRQLKVHCVLTICVPSGAHENHHAPSSVVSYPEDDEDCSIKNGNHLEHTLELAKANLEVEFAPSTRATSSGPLLKYRLLGIKPTIAEYEEGSDSARTIQSVAMMLARDKLVVSAEDVMEFEGAESGTGGKRKVKRWLFSRIRAFTGNSSNRNSFVDEH